MTEIPLARITLQLNYNREIINDENFSTILKKSNIIEATWKWNNSDKVYQLFNNSTLSAKYISGPVVIYHVQYKDKIFLLGGDIHNSNQGICQNNPSMEDIVRALINNNNMVIDVYGETNLTIEKFIKKDVPINRFRSSLNPCFEDSYQNLALCGSNIRYHWVDPRYQCKSLRIGLIDLKSIIYKLDINLPLELYKHMNIWFKIDKIINNNNENTYLLQYLFLDLMSLDLAFIILLPYGSMLSLSIKQDYNNKLNKLASEQKNSFSNLIVRLVNSTDIDGVNIIFYYYFNIFIDQIQSWGTEAWNNVQFFLQLLSSYLQAKYQDLIILLKSRVDTSNTVSIAELFFDDKNEKILELLNDEDKQHVINDINKGLININDVIMTTILKEINHILSPLISIYNLSMDLYLALSIVENYDNSTTHLNLVYAGVDHINNLIKLLLLRGAIIKKYPNQIDEDNRCISLSQSIFNLLLPRFALDKTQLEIIPVNRSNLI